MWRLTKWISIEHHEHAEESIHNISVSCQQGCKEVQRKEKKKKAEKKHDLVNIKAIVSVKPCLVPDSLGYEKHSNWCARATEAKTYAVESGTKYGVLSQLSIDFSQYRKNPNKHHVTPAVFKPSSTAVLLSCNHYSYTVTLLGVITWI